METAQNVFEVSTLSSRETNNIIYFPDLVNPNTFVDKTVDMCIENSLENENALEEFIIAETQGFLVKLERELRPRPQFYALTRPGTHQGFYGAGRSEASNPIIEYIKSNTCNPFKETEDNKEVIVEIDEKEPKKEKKQAQQKKTKQTKITSFTIKSNRKSANFEEKSDNSGETSQKNTTRKKGLSTAESSLKKKIKTNSEAEEEALKLPEEDSTENKRDAKKGSGNNRGRPKGSLNKNKKNMPTKKSNSRKIEVDTSFSTSSLTSMSPNDSPTPKKRKYNRVSESSKKSNTSPPMTPAREGGLEMILNMDNFVVNTTAMMNSAMTITSSSP